jgi:hypothetical protein
MAATDVALTKANRKTILELQHLGVPSIALSFGLNPIDDKAAEAAEGVLFRRAAELTSRQLKDQIEIALQTRPMPPAEVARGGQLAAARISHHLEAATRGEDEASAIPED